MSDGALPANAITFCSLAVCTRVKQVGGRRQGKEFVVFRVLTFERPCRFSVQCLLSQRIRPSHGGLSHLPEVTITWWYNSDWSLAVLSLWIWVAAACMWPSRAWEIKKNTQKIWEWRQVSKVSGRQRSEEMLEWRTRSHLFAHRVANRDLEPGHRASEQNGTFSWTRDLLRLWLWIHPIPSTRTALRGRSDVSQRHLSPWR